MAIQVNGTTVINNSRALNNISSIDATTAAAIGNAGVGGGGWTALNNSYTTNYYSCTSTQDTGWLDMSTILSGLPTDYKLLYIQARPRVPLYNGSDAGSQYVYFYEGDSFRLGTSSSSYNQYNQYGDSKYGNGDVDTTGLTSRSQGIGGTSSAIYTYSNIIASLIVGVPAVNPTNMPSQNPSLTMGSSLETNFSHLYNRGSFQQHSDNVTTGTVPTSNITYFAWRRAWFTGANSIANNQQANWQIGWTFTASYYK